jgi:biopolymer transport protein ExbB/TolQ
MGLKGFRLISFFATAMGLLVASIATMQALARLASPSSRPPISDALVPVALAFVAIGMLAGMAYTTLKAQAEQIANLERKLAER